MPPPRLCALAVLLLALSQGCNGQQMRFMDVCPLNDIPASGNVTDLTELTFWGKVSDGRVWFVEFYADFCRGCKRVADHVSKLADTLDSTHPDIAVARVNCENAVHFCDQVISISRTPSFKVYYEGKKAMNYDTDFYFYDMMLGFITDITANLKGFSVEPSWKEQLLRAQASGPSRT